MTARDSDRDKTIADFGEQWTTYRGNPAYYGSRDLLGDIFGPLLPLTAVNAAHVADIGSGTGRIVNMLLDAGAAHVHAVEPSDAIEVLRENTAARRDSVTYLHGRGETLPSGLHLDLVVSIGVLHHIPDPVPVIRAAYDALKPGGRLLVWLYGHEGNETYLSLAEPLRNVTTRLPHLGLVWLCHILNLGLDAYISLCHFLPLPMRSYMRGVLAKFPRRIRFLTIYDQLNPAYAKYYTRDEAESLLRDAGFVSVQSYHRHNYSWTVVGQRPERA
jgi:SAM-dependent methyltransferase